MGKAGKLALALDDGRRTIGDMLTYAGTIDFLDFTTK